MKTSKRTVLAAAAVLLSSSILGISSPATAAAPPDLVDYTIAADGTLRVVNDRGTVPGLFPVLPTAIGNSHYSEPPAAGAPGILTFKAVVGGVLTLYDVQAGGFEPQAPPVVSKRAYGSGWSAMRQLVEGTRLYALHSNGSLYRYSKPTPTAAYTGAGSAAGFGSVQSMALVHSDSRKDVLLMNLKGGSLYQVTIPTTSAMKTTVVPVRTRSWQGFKQLLTSPKPNGSIYLQGVNATTGLSTVYDLGPMRGAATTIRTLGSPSSTPLTQPLYMSGAFADFPYRGAP